MKLNKKDMLSLFETMVKIREFEEKARELFLAGKLAGFLHLYSGEEAVAAGVCSVLTSKDYITSTHRGHGHIIAKGGDMRKMMAELFGKSTGYSKGKSGSMHIADLSIGIVGANGIVGAGIPIGVGAAFALKYQKNDAVVVSFFGDGASNRGTFHEALNMASIWDLPIVFVCENNGYGMSIPQKEHQRVEDVSVRACAYGIGGVTVDGNDAVVVATAAAEAVKRARNGQGPTLLECKTWRHHGHYIGDPQQYKDPEVQQAWLLKDPIPRLEKKLLEEGIADQSEIDMIKANVKAIIDEAVEFSINSPEPALAELYTDVYAD